MSLLCLKFCSEYYCSQNEAQTLQVQSLHELAPVCLSGLSSPNSHKTGQFHSCTPALLPLSLACLQAFMHTLPSANTCLPNTVFHL